MPANVRNYWVQCDIDGRKTRLESGPQSANGGFTESIAMRDHDRVSWVLELDGLVSRPDENGTRTLTLRLQTRPGVKVSVYDRDGNPVPVPDGFYMEIRTVRT